MVIDRDKLKIPVVFETEFEAVVVKPSGMASQLTTDPRGSSLISRLRSSCPENLSPELPHRLDRITRGLMLVALNRESLVFHNQNIQDKNWKKYYLARVTPENGANPEDLLGQHKAYLKKKGQIMTVVRSGGKPSFLNILHTSPAPGRPGEYHIFLELLTGRYHQIRVMLANLGIPLTHDFLYGKRKCKIEDFYLESIILQFTDFKEKAKHSIYYEKDPLRESLALPMRERIRKTAHSN